MFLKSVFSRLSVGDVITAGDYIYVVCREVHPANIAKSDHRYALALICSCDDHAEYVLTDSYAYDDSQKALTKVDGTVLLGWTAYATVKRDAYKNTDLSDLAHAMTSEDIPASWGEIIDVRRNELLLKKAITGARYAETNQLRIFSILRAIGIKTTQDEAFVLLALLRIMASS